MEQEEKDSQVSQTKESHHNLSDTDRKIIRRRREFRLIIGSLIILVVAIIIFLAGMVVGRLQGRFDVRRTTSGFGMMSGSSGQYGYGQGHPTGGTGMALGTPGMLGGANGQRSMANANGAQGTITAINGDDLTVNGANGVSDTITVTSSTIIRQKAQGTGDLKITDLHTGETVTVLGDPDSQGKIVAKYIGVQ